MECHVPCWVLSELLLQTRHYREIDGEERRATQAGLRTCFLLCCNSGLSPVNARVPRHNVPLQGFHQILIVSSAVKFGDFTITCTILHIFPSLEVWIKRLWSAIKKNFDITKFSTHNVTVCACIHVCPCIHMFVSMCLCVCVCREQGPGRKSRA